MRNFKIVLAAALLAAFWAGPVFAHGGEEHGHSAPPAAEPQGYHGHGGYTPPGAGGEGASSAEAALAACMGENARQRVEHAMAGQPFHVSAAVAGTLVAALGLFLRYGGRRNEAE